eukprot:scaffold4272_cov98-Cylindrotheca_fusiformis.AAC.2
MGYHGPKHFDENSIASYNNNKIMMKEPRNHIIGIVDRPLSFEEVYVSLIGNICYKTLSRRKISLPITVDQLIVVEEAEIGRHNDTRLDTSYAQEGHHGVVKRVPSRNWGGPCSNGWMGVENLRVGIRILAYALLEGESVCQGAWTVLLLGPQL